MDEFNTLQVVMLYRHEIEHNVVQRKKMSRATMLSIGVIVLGLMSFLTSYIAKGYYTTLKNTISVMHYSPINSLYSDTGGIVFTSATGYERYNMSKDVELMLPVLSGSTTVGDNFISFVIDDSIIVVASSDGVVQEIGTNSEGHKFIVLKHSKNISTMYTNIDVAGVVKGDEVTAGNEIATAKVGQTVTFVVLNDGEAVNNLSIEQNKVIWQS